MTHGSPPNRRFTEIQAKLDSDDELDVSDVEFLLTYSQYDETHLNQYRERITERITESVGHAVYTSILGDFEEAGVIDEWRPDLIDPSIDPTGFETVELNDRTRYRHRTVGTEASEYVGFIHPPDKQPTKLWAIRQSLLDYLFCTGRGFHLDAEMIYDFETDYRELLLAVIERTDCLSESALEVTCSGDEPTTVDIEIVTDERSYSVAFEQRGDWLRTEAFEPVRDALNDRTTTEMYYRGGNDGWLLVVSSDDYDVVERYLAYPAEFP